MLRTHLNFATHPIRNYALYSAGFRAAALALAGATLLHGLWLWNASAARGDARGVLEEAQRRAARLEGGVSRLSRELDAESLGDLSRETLWANGLIDARQFSWTALLGDVERVLPPSVFLESIAPAVDRDGAVKLRLAVVAKTPADLAEFLDALESSPLFRGAYPSGEREKAVKHLGFGTVSDVHATYLPSRSPSPSAPPVKNRAAAPRAETTS